MPSLYAERDTVFIWRPVNFNVPGAVLPRARQWKLVIEEHKHTNHGPQTTPGAQRGWSKLSEAHRVFLARTAEDPSLAKPKKLEAALRREYPEVQDETHDTVGCSRCCPLRLLICVTGMDYPDGEHCEQLATNSDMLRINRRTVHLSLFQADLLSLVSESN
jgi:hypothetical protein